MRTAVGIVLFAAVLAAGCDADPAPEPRPSPTPFLSPGDLPTDFGAADCPDAAASGRSEPGAGMSGDVTGDGEPDRALVVVDPSADAGCRRVLVVHVGGTGEALVRSLATGAELGPAEPAVLSVVDVDGSGGEEIIVRIGTGASTQFAMVFTHAGQGLRRIEVAGPGSAGQGALPLGGTAFAYGGSVGHVEAVDCVDDLVVATTAVPGPIRGDELVYRIRRLFLEPSGATWRLRPDRTRTVTMPLEQALEELPEFAGSPFGDCA